MINNYKRAFYLEKIKKDLGNTELIKVLIGRRIVGKSYSQKIYQFYYFLKLREKTLNYLYYTNFGM